jgi:hypothetical protein
MFEMRRNQRDAPFHHVFIFVADADLVVHGSYRQSAANLAKFGVPGTIELLFF